MRVWKSAMMFAFCFIAVCALDGSLIKSSWFVCVPYHGQVCRTENTIREAGGENEKDMQNCVKEWLGND